MKTQIIHISKLQTAKVMAVLYLVISLPLTLFMFLPPLITHQPVQWGMIWWLPLFYTIYNGVAGWIGGIEFTVSERAAE
jgi:hypothetical protein